MEKIRSGTVKTITSIANPIIKDLRALSLKKNREREGLFIVEGLKLVLEGLETGHKIRILAYAEQDSAAPLALPAAARAYSAGALVIKTSAKIMALITRRDNAQNLIGVFEQQWQSAELLLRRQAAAEKGGKPQLLLALDRVRDPGNLGTIIRTADAVGAAGLLLIGDTVSPYSSEAARATMGSIFAVPLARLSEQEFLQRIQRFNGQIIGTHLQGATDYRRIAYFENGKNVLLLMGNEQKGLSAPLAAACAALARIPQAGRADSLNLAVSTGIMLYEICRNRLTL